MSDLLSPQRILRPDDLLVVDVEWSNLRISADGQRLERIDPAAAAILVFHFPPQHVAERVFLESASGLEAAEVPPVGALASQGSRLAFSLPEGRLSLPLADLLGWDHLVARLAGNALPPEATAGPAPAAPAADVTAIEFPYRLQLSPDANATWAHRRDVFMLAGRTELWHTRLTGKDATVPVRAIARRSVSDSVRTSLTDTDLADLVTLTGDFTAAQVPRPFEIERLMLTALGASARLRGHWRAPAVSLESYEHAAGGGRDQRVEVVRRGWVSSGHRASIVKVTERQFEPRLLRTEQRPEGEVGVFGATAYLRQSVTVVIDQPEVRYSELTGGYANNGREMPLRALVLTTLVTPKIDLDIPLEGLEHMPWWIRVGGKDFEFGADAVDWEGERITFTTPLVFVPDAFVANSAAVLAKFAEGPPERRTRPFRNQAFALADPAFSAPRSTRAPIETLTFALQAVPPEREGWLPATYRPRWLLSVSAAEAHLEPVERITGRREAVGLSFDPAYLAHGLAATGNPAGTFAAFSPAQISVPAERGGGLARLDAPVSRLSSRQGALPETFAKPTISKADLASLFKDARLLGTIPLGSILAELGSVDPGAFANADLPEAELQQKLDHLIERLEIPILRTRPLEQDGRIHAVETRYVWKPRLATSDLPKMLAFDERSALVLDARIVTPLDGTAAQSDVRGTLRRFALRFPDVLEVRMDELAFSARSGRKPDVTAAGFDLAFLGPLAFVNALKDVVPADGFSDPPAVEVTTAGIKAGYTLSIPTVAVGILSLQNLSLSAGLAVPFSDHPAGMHFGISERHHPFIVTVSLFGGGGFFALGVSAEGVEEVEAAIEFGGNVSIDLGVASGGIYVMAGIYFGLTAEAMTLTGYVRCGGYLSVLGLISISIEFHLSLSYREIAGGSEVWGQASVTVCVAVAFFSKTLQLTMERRFAGSPRPQADRSFAAAELHALPHRASSVEQSFERLIEPADWEQYCLAFAA